MAPNHSYRRGIHHQISRSSASSTNENDFSDDRYILSIWKLLSGARSLPSTRSSFSVYYRPETINETTAGETPSNTLTERKNGSPTSRVRAAWRCFIHLPAVSITLVLLSLSWREVFWETPTAATDSKLGALQFFAKMHEILIVISLSHLAFDKIQLSLLSGASGVPFGFLGASKQIESAEYILSQEFWQGFAFHRRSIRRLALAVFLLLLFVLATVAGPASAIVLIPSLDWWSFPINQSWQIFVRNQNLVFFPLNINLNYAIEGASSGFVTIFSYYEQHQLVTNGFYFAPVNISIGIQNSLFQRQMTGTGLPRPNSDHSHYASSTIPVFTSSSLAAMWHVLRLTPGAWNPTRRVSIAAHLGAGPTNTNFAGDPPDKTIYKPFVQVECSTENFDLSGSELPLFPHDNLAQFNDPSQRDSNWHLPASTMARLMDEVKVFPVVTDNSTFHWVDMDFVGEKHPSLGAAWYGRASDGTDSLHLCTIDARWVPVNIWIDPDMNSAIQEDSSDLVRLTKFLPKLAYNPIHISKAWASMMADADNLFSNTDSLQVTSTATNYLWEQCRSASFMASNGHSQGSSASSVMSHCLGARLAPWLTESLANLQGTMSIFLQYPVYKPGQDPLNTKPSNWTSSQLEGLLMPDFINFPPPDFPGDASHDIGGDLSNDASSMPLHFTAKQYGYGYGWCSIITYVAASILMLHVLLVLLHICHLLLRGKNAWTSISDLTILAWNSRADERLRGANYGVKDKRIWGKIVRLVIGRDGQLELVMDEESGLGASASAIQETVPVQRKRPPKRPVNQASPDIIASRDQGKIPRVRFKPTATETSVQHPRRIGSEWI